MQSLTHHKTKALMERFISFAGVDFCEAVLLTIFNNMQLKINLNVLVFYFAARFHIAFYSVWLPAYFYGMFL